MLTPTAYVVYHSGLLKFDLATGQVTRGGEAINLSAPQLAMLQELMANAPAVVEKDDLATAGWGSTGASHNNIEQAMYHLRKALGPDGDAIETVRHRGYRFVTPVERLERLDAPVPKVVEVEYRDFYRGQRELATLNLEAIKGARRDFARHLKKVPTDAQAHAAMSMACALIYEASRVGPSRDYEALELSIHHARLATTLDPVLADGWSTLGFALYLSGDFETAAGAARKAVLLQRDGWRHWLRLAYVTWGDERFDSAHRALILRHELALAHWLKSTVLIARGVFEAALISIRAGCIEQDKQRHAPGPYPAVGLHLLHGLVLAALGRLDEAMREFELELDIPDHGQLYARERDANTWYARGAIHLRQGDHDAAARSFQRALEFDPGHYSSMAALGKPLPAVSPSGERGVEATIAHAIRLTREGRHPAAADLITSALKTASSPHAGWILPVEPILHVSARPEIWSDALTIVHRRAT